MAEFFEAALAQAKQGRSVSLSLDQGGQAAAIRLHASTVTREKRLPLSQLEGVAGQAAAVAALAELVGEFAPTPKPAAQPVAPVSRPSPSPEKGA